MGGKINSGLYQMHLASLTEIPSHCDFTDPQVIDYCTEEKWKNSKYGSTFSHQANKRVVVFWHPIFFSENRTRWLDDCTVTRSLVLTTFEPIFTNVPVKGRTVWRNYTKRKTQKWEIYFCFETFSTNHHAFLLSSVPISFCFFSEMFLFTLEITFYL